MSKRTTPERPASDRHKGTSAFAGAPTGRARFIISAFIMTWLTWQLLVPMTYYAGNDVDDERFSWRMFSGIWLLQKSCKASVTEFLAQTADDASAVRKVDLERTLHGTWVSQIRRKNRSLVVEKFLPTRCEKDPEVVRVEYVRTCAAASDARIPRVVRTFDCRAGAFTGP